MKDEDSYHPDFYNVNSMTSAQAWARGFHQGITNQGPFGIWRSLEANPNPRNALLVAAWLKGWAKGHQLYLDQTALN